MTKSGTRTFAAMLLAVMLVFAAGCGGSSKTSTAPNTPEQRKADRALGAKSVLKLADLPSGYKGTPHKTDSSNDTPAPVLRKFASCAKVPQAKIDQLLNGKTDPKEVEVNAPDFAQRDASTGFSTTFENSVDLERSSKDLQEPFDLFTAQSAFPCWKDLFRSVFVHSTGTGASIRDLSIVPISTGKIGDQSGGFGVRLTVAGKARSVNAYIDLYLARSGRAGISLLATGIGERVDTSLALSLLQTVADRMKGTT